MSESLPDVAERLAQLTERMAEQQPASTSWELTSDREVEASDADQVVTATIRNYELTRLFIDPQWTAQLGGDTRPVEQKVTEAVNAALKQFLEAELTDAMDAQYDMPGLAADLRQLSADTTAALDRHIADSLERLPR